jgi:hypothetical protein
LRSGERRWVLLHLEIQTSYEEGFEVRLARYYGGLFSVFGESLRTRYVTSAERIAEPRGLVVGGATVRRMQLRKLCGALPEAVEARVRRLSMERLGELGEAVLEYPCPVPLPTYPLSPGSGKSGKSGRKALSPAPPLPDLPDLPDFPHLGGCRVPC